MARPGKGPIVPEMDDCKMIVETEDAVCYIMDTFCKDLTAEENLKLDRQIIQIARQAAVRRQLSRLA